MEKEQKFTIPSDFAGCLSLEKTAKEWRIWSERTVVISKVLSAAMILWGVIQGAMEYWQRRTEVLNILFGIGVWVLLAGILIAVFCILSLVFQTIAGISENVGVMTRIIVFQSAVDGYPDSRLEDHYYSESQK